MDEARLVLTRAWLVKAGNDLRNARIVSAVQDGPLDTAIYHCQQAAEKAVKAFLIWHDQVFPKTHEIGSLVEHRAPVAATLACLRRFVRNLSELRLPFRRER
ncbi:MAG: HEPN domain-containing protein [Chthoniobacterales bacterium]|nr:HEPN domain-containing protein [Chthoniobacterales bacterium]